jgi:hypothetical protein
MIYYDKIFHGENMLTKLEQTFCESLKKYVDENSPNQKGFITKLSKMIGISQPQLSNIIGKRKPTDEETRRKIASIIGIEYDVMIGLKPKYIPNNTPAKVYAFPIEYRPPPVDQRLESMHENLNMIYKHGDDGLKSAIEMNLKAFSKTIEMEIRMNQKDQDISSLKEEIENLKKTVNNPSG